MPVDRIPALVAALGRQRVGHLEQVVESVRRAAGSVEPDDVVRLAGALERELGDALAWVGRRVDRLSATTPLPVEAAVVHATLETVRQVAVTGIRQTAGVVTAVLDRGEDVVAAPDVVEDVAAPAPQPLPIPNYDSLNAAAARESVQALHDADAVAAVLAYEQQHRNRKTVVGAAQAWLDELRAATAEVG